MKTSDRRPLTFNSLFELMQRLKLPAPQHPLLALIDYSKVKPDLADAGTQFLLDFYKISFKTRFQGNLRYGPGKYDFREGGLAFLAPHQLVEMPGDTEQYEGYSLYFHPDLITGYGLARTIHHYGFFSYAVSEALYLSEKEKKVIGSLFEAIAMELENGVDQISQDVLVSQLELLLQHSNRFYHRQFLTRQPLHHDLIGRMQAYLSDCFDQQTFLLTGLPSARQLAEHLSVSQRYLSDMLRSLTGKTTQQHIHLQLIERAKELLATSTLTTAEIAYQLGFEHPQSFNKLFKQKTRLSPALFRQALQDQPS
jgi:AraC-like DNA-binding protein